jgi:hypothetical protein
MKTNTLTLRITHASEKETNRLMLELENKMEDLKEAGVIKKANWWFKIK